MIYFIYGKDSYRSKRKLEEMIDGYKKVHKSGLNLIYTDANAGDFMDFYGNLQINSMFSEKKLIVLKNVFLNPRFQEELLNVLDKLKDSKDIIIIYEDIEPDKRTKTFKALQKDAKYQEFSVTSPINIRKWALDEFGLRKIEIDPQALDLLVSANAQGDLWKMANEINKLSNYKPDGVITKKDVGLMVNQDIENEIFKTIEAIASKDKKQATILLHKHLESGDNSLYLLSMIAFQFRNLLVIKELQDLKTPYGAIAKKSGLHPFVVQKSYYLCNRFTLEGLKEIYRDIFEADSDIKTGKIDPELALDLLVSKI